MRFFTIRFLEHFAYPLTPYVTLYLSWGIFQIIQRSCRAVQRGYFQETLGCRKEFDLAQLKEKNSFQLWHSQDRTPVLGKSWWNVSLAFSVSPSPSFYLWSLSQKGDGLPSDISPFFLSLLSLSCVMECGRVVWFITSWRLRMASL